MGNGLTDGVTIGPLIDDRAVEKSEEHVKDALDRGATLVSGGQRLSGGEYEGGSFYRRPCSPASPTRC